MKQLGPVLAAAHMQCKNEKKKKIQPLLHCISQRQKYNTFHESLFFAIILDFISDNASSSMTAGRLLMTYGLLETQREPAAFLATSILLLAFSLLISKSIN